MRSLTFISIIISVLFGQFDNSGTSAANFLKIGVGGRAAATKRIYTIVDKPIRIKNEDHLPDLQIKYCNIA